MIEIIIDGKKMISKKIVHSYIKQELNAMEYYGENLDSLWDILSTYDRNIKIQLINIDKIMENLGDYGESIITVFKDAEEENSKIKLEIMYT